MMGKAYIFYNPNAGDGKILEDLDALEFVLDDPCTACDMSRPETYCEALFAMEAEDYLVLCGGDGTLNRFVNLTGDLQRTNEIYYYPSGNGNAFALTHGYRYGCNPFAVTDSLRRLPTVAFKRKSERFVTGILFDATTKNRRLFKRGKAYTDLKTVTISTDGVKRQFQKVQFLAVMYGKYCGGGFAPDPGRRRGEESLSLVVISGCGRQKAKGLLKQLRRGSAPHSACYTCIRANDLQITFDSMTCLQIDGETHSDVAAFTVKTHRKETQR